MNYVQWQNFVETLFGWRTYWTLWQNGYLNNRFFEHWWNSIIIDNSFCQSLIEINIFCHCISQLSSIQTLCTIFSRNECRDFEIATFCFLTSKSHISLLSRTSELLRKIQNFQREINQQRHICKKKTYVNRNC